jgi:hypothetical protein
MKLPRLNNKSIALVILLFGIFAAGVVYAAHNECFGPDNTPSTHQNCYWASANKANTTTVLEFSSNYCVQNANSLDIFIPTKTSAEWSAFRANAPRQTLTAYTSGVCGGGGTCQPTPYTVSGSSNSTADADQIASNNIPHSPEDWYYAAGFLIADIDGQNCANSKCTKIAYKYNNDQPYWPTTNGSKSGSATITDVSSRYVINWTTNISSGNYTVTLNYTTFCPSCAPDGYTGGDGLCHPFPTGGGGGGGGECGWCAGGGDGYNVRGGKCTPCP